MWRAILLALFVGPALAQSVGLAQPYVVPAGRTVTAAEFQIGGSTPGACAISTSGSLVTPKCDVSGLAPGSTYSIRMRMNDEAGPGDWSAPLVVEVKKSCARTSATVFRCSLDYITAAAPASVSYVVTGSQAFPLNPDGTRSVTPISTPPVKGSTCDCAAVKIQQYGATFCKVSITGITQTVVAGCGVR